MNYKKIISFMVLGSLFFTLPGADFLWALKAIGNYDQLRSPGGIDGSALTEKTDLADVELNEKLQAMFEKGYIDAEERELIGFVGENKKNRQ